MTTPVRLLGVEIGVDGAVGGGMANGSATRGIEERGLAGGCEGVLLFMRLANGPTFRRYPNNPRVNNTTKATSRRAPAAKATFALRVFHQRRPCFPDENDPALQDEIPGPAASCCRSTVPMSPSPVAAGAWESASGHGAGVGLWLSGEDEDGGDPSLEEEGSAVIETSGGVCVADSHSSPLTLICRSFLGVGVDKRVRCWGMFVLGEPRGANGGSKEGCK